MINQEKLKAFKELIDQFTNVCYAIGKAEGLKGIKKESPKEIREIPLEIIQDIISEIKEEPTQEMGFTITIPKIEKIQTTTEKEQELITKFGRQKMEKLAKEMKFKGKILNNKKYAKKSI